MGPRAGTDPKTPFPSARLSGSVLSLRCPLGSVSVRSRALPRVAVTHPLSLCSTHPASTNRNLTRFIYIINQGLPEERCKCNILKSNILAESDSHRPSRVWCSQGFGTEGGRTPVCVGVCSWAGVWAEARAAVAGGALATAPPVTSCDTRGTSLNCLKITLSR